MPSDGETWAQITGSVIVLLFIIVAVLVSRGGGEDEEAPEAPLRDEMPRDGEAGLPESFRRQGRPQVVPASER